MASVAEKKRVKDVARRVTPVAAPAPKAPVTNVDAERRPYVARDDGLTKLRDKSRISVRQAWAGRTFGALWRTAGLSNGAPIRSFLELRPRGAIGGGFPGSTDGGPEWVSECRRRLEDAYEALGHNPGMVGTLVLICGYGLHPREISTVQREAEQIETTLRNALDILAARWRSQGFGGVGAWPSEGLESWSRDEVAESACAD